MRRAIAGFLALSAVIVPSARADDARDADAIGRAIDSGRPPQPPRAADLFRRARPFEGASFEGMLLCEVRVSGESWDGQDPIGPVRRFMGRPDVDVELTTPSGRIFFEGPEDVARVTIAVADARVSRGESVTLVIEDRDVLDDDPIATVTLAYDGTLPMRATAEATTVECRGLSPSALAPLIDAAVQAADHAIAALPPIGAPDPAIVHFRETEKEETTARLATYDIARYAGPGDARYLDRLAALDERRARWTAARTRLVASTLRTAPEPGTAFEVPGSPIRVRVDDLVCDIGLVFDLHRVVGLDSDLTCALRVTLSHDEATPQPLSFQLHVLTADGETTAAPIVLVDVDDELRRPSRGQRLPRGEHRVVLALDTQEPVLLRVATREGFVFARVARRNPPARSQAHP